MGTEKTTRNIVSTQELHAISGWYVMNYNGDIKPAESYKELRENDGAWRRWWKIGDTQLNRLLFLPSTQISTVFLGLDHSYRREAKNYKPIVFETMIFGGPLDQYQSRYATIEEAKHGHETHVRAARIARFVGGSIAEWYLRRNGL